MGRGWSAVRPVPALARASLFRPRPFPTTALGGSLIGPTPPGLARRADLRGSARARRPGTLAVAFLCRDSPRVDSSPQDRHVDDLYRNAVTELHGVARSPAHHAQPIIVQLVTVLPEILQADQHIDEWSVQRGKN